MHKYPLHTSLALLIAVTTICLLPGFASAATDKNYECAGKNDNGMVVFREFPTLHFFERQLKIAGSDVYSSYSYAICEESDSLMVFATRREVCRAGPAEINSLGSSNGSFNKVSGRLELFGAQGMHGEYQCKETRKKY